MPLTTAKKTLEEVSLDIATGIFFDCLNYNLLINLLLF